MLEEKISDAKKRKKDGKIEENNTDKERKNENITLDRTLVNRASIAIMCGRAINSEISKKPNLT